MKIAALAIRYCLVFWLIVLSHPAPAVTAEKSSDQTVPESCAISGVAVDPKQFDPSRGEKVTIAYGTSKPCKAVIKIFDPEMQLVRDLMSETRGKSETVQVVWDGKDAQGRLVPDEAYFFTIEASDYQGHMASYDPTIATGGQTSVPGGAYFDSETNKVRYSIQEDSRVSLKVGIANGGPLLKNILNGVPQTAGEHAETWDGKDQSGEFNATAQKDYQLSVEATPLYANSIIARGNDAYDFFRYRRDIASERPRKVDRPPPGRELIWYGLPRPEPITMIPEPKFRLELPKSGPDFSTGVPVVAGKIPIKIYLDESIKKYITEQRYEIIFFLDFHFVTEKEEGYSPFTLIWDTLGTPNGEHVVTINVATFSGQVSSGSARVMIRNER
jgi:flagellar hook assembly protein FlgD